MRKRSEGLQPASKRTDLSVDEKKEKARWARILRIYGITPAQYDELDLGYCPICLRIWNDTVRPNVDHDHVTGDVRGILCTFCNRYRAGRLRDAELVYRIASYLGAKRKGWIVPPKPKRRRKRKVKK